MNTAEKDVAMKEERKDLAYDFEYFKEQVAKKNGGPVYKIFDQEYAQENWNVDDLYTEAAELYAEHCFLQGKQEGEVNKEEACDRIQELFCNPLKELKPLEDLWRKENPDPQGRYVCPDATNFYKWIVSKVKQQEE